MTNVQLAGDRGCIGAGQLVGGRFNECNSNWDTATGGMPYGTISAVITVERDSQKGIVIGRRGELLKRIGTEAREELETLLGVKIFLELFVKVERNWRDNTALVRQLDWHRQLERLAEE